MDFSCEPGVGEGAPEEGQSEERPDGSNWLED